MFWLRNKKFNFHLRTLILTRGLLKIFTCSKSSLQTTKFDQNESIQTNYQIMKITFYIIDYFNSEEKTTHMSARFYLIDNHAFASSV